MRIARYRVVPPKWPSVDFSCQRSIDGEKAKKKKKKRKRRKKTSFPRAGRKIEATATQECAERYCTAQDHVGRLMSCGV
ncbi:hypothetical protein GW17_00034960 [Ensete ventricosum]|nr:hypothetical protein GW17_00034960 [Ensete ventricosum]